MNKSKDRLKKRIEDLEVIALGMGFMIHKMYLQFGDELNIGMTEQVQEALKDYRNIQAVIINRNKQKEALASTS